MLVRSRVKMSHLETASQGKNFLKLSPQEQDQQQQLLPFYDLLPQVKRRVTFIRLLYRIINH